MKNLLARLALLGSIAAFVAVASSAFAQDKPPAPGAEAKPAATAPAAPAAAPAAVPKCADKGFDCNKGDVAWMLTSPPFVLPITVPRSPPCYSAMPRPNNA